MDGDDTMHRTIDGDPCDSPMIDEGTDRSYTGITVRCEDCGALLVLAELDEGPGSLLGHGSPHEGRRVTA